MKIKLILIFLIISISSCAQQNQINLKTEINLGDGFNLTTFLKAKKSNNRIIFTSPKNADIRLFGWFKAKLGRLLGKSPKKGIFATIDCKQKKDSIIGDMKIPMLGKIKFKGTYKNEILNGKMIKNDTLIIGSIVGINSKETKINYKYLYPKIIEITEKNIYSKSALKTPEWKNFKRKLKKTLSKIQDDIELFFSFNMTSPELPFSHYNLIMQDTLTIKTENSKSNREITVIYEKKNRKTAYLKIKNFSTSTNELKIILPKILKENPENLIIDLRDNGGGGIEAAFEFGKFLMNHTEIGFFTTNKFLIEKFNKKLFDKLSKVKPQTTDEFINFLKREKGAKLIFSNSNKRIYTGNLYILINKNTASTCEPIVYVLKKNKRATIIGETTAGAMLSATAFPITDKYQIIIPIADFYTFDGVRLENIGVSPDIETKSDKALDKALEIIKNKTK